jgi:predicted nucleic acid-binding protein
VAAFLLDSNILFTLLDARKAIRYTNAWDHLRAIPQGTRIAVSAMALSEADVGCCLGQRDIILARAEISDLIRQHRFYIEPVTQFTAPHYGDLKARLCRKYQPKRARWPERWKDIPTGADIGVEEPDLIMAAQALEHGYVLVTGDGMDQIRTVLRDANLALDFEDWTKP